MLNKRDYGIDMLRFVACCAVVGLHTFTKGITLTSTVAYYACGFAVPIFFMCSGAFLLNRGGVDWSYVVKKLRRLLNVLVLWASVLSLVYVIGKLITGTDDAATLVSVFPITLFGSLFQIGLLSHGWFLWALAIVYCFLPLLSSLSLRGKLNCFLLFASFGLVAQGLSCFVGFPLASFVPQTFRIWIWLEYFLLGGLLYSLCSRSHIFENGLALIAACIVAIVWQMYAGIYLMPEATGSAHAEYFYDGLPCLVLCATLFIFSIRLRPDSKPWEYLGSLTMGVYLFHLFVVRALGHFISFSDAVWASGLGFIAVLLISLFAIGFVKKFLSKVYLSFCEV